MAYSYYELYDPEFRKKLLDIMKKTCEIGDRDSSEEPTEELITAFIDKVKKQAHGVPLVFCFKDIYSAMTHDHNQVHTRAQHGEETRWRHATEVNVQEEPCIQRLHPANCAQKKHLAIT